MSRTSLPLRGEAPLAFDDFRVSRQVRLSPEHEGGFAVVRFEHPVHGTIYVRYGRDDLSPEVSSIWRRGD